MNERSQGPLKIMIVDDHVGFRELMRGFFPSPAYEVEECPDGGEALAAYRRFRPDWVMMDFVMKGLDGIAATQQILAEFPAARVLIVTDYLDAALSALARRVGAYGLIAKDNLGQLRRFLEVSDANGNSATREMD